MPDKHGKPTHGEIQKAIKDLLAWHRWRVWHNQQGLGSYPGVTDLTATKRGYGDWWIEIKTPGTTLSKTQREFRDMILAEQGRWSCFYSVDEAIKEITELEAI